MTKEEILKIIEQNKDVLTPENYQGILKNVDIFTEEEKLKIAHYLQMAHEMMKANEAYMKAQNTLFKKTGDELKGIDQQISKDMKNAYKKAEESEQSKESDSADDLLSNL